MIIAHCPHFVKVLDGILRFLEGFRLKILGADQPTAAAPLD
jgi:hypothetical protein